jgi:hypothetical protein
MTLAKLILPPIGDFRNSGKSSREAGGQNQEVRLITCPRAGHGCNLCTSNACIITDRRATEGLILRTAGFLRRHGSEWHD